MCVCVGGLGLVMISNDVFVNIVSLYVLLIGSIGLSSPNQTIHYDVGRCLSYKL